MCSWMIISKAVITERKPTIKNIQSKNKAADQSTTTSEHGGIKNRVKECDCMKKKVIIILSVVVLVIAAVAVVAFLSVGRAGGEIGFEATINKVEDGIAYATVIEQDTGFLTKKLPESIMFETADLDKELNAGDKISGCYLHGSIDGQTVRVVSVVVTTD